MSLIARIALLVLAVPLVLASGSDCGSGHFRYVFRVDVEKVALNLGLGGPPRTAVFPTEDQANPPAHPLTLTAPSTGRGTPTRAAVLLISHRAPSLLPSAPTAGTGTPVPSAAILPHPLPPPSRPPNRLEPLRAKTLGSLTVTMTRAGMAIAVETIMATVTAMVMAMETVVAMARAEMATTSASLPRSAKTAPVMLPLALGASLLALSLA